MFQPLEAMAAGFRGRQKRKHMHAPSHVDYISMTEEGRDMEVAEAR